MYELVRSEDRVLLLSVAAGLDEAGIPWFVFDVHTSSAYGGALGAIACRVMVADEDADRAKCVLSAILDRVKRHV